MVPRNVQARSDPRNDVFMCVPLFKISHLANYYAVVYEWRRHYPLSANTIGIINAGKIIPMVNNQVGSYNSLTVHFERSDR